MLVEIWSDVVCPFCYIGKMRFNQALRKFPHRDFVEVAWKSFLLNPEVKRKPGLKQEDYLSSVKGWTISQVREMNAYVTEMGKGAGIDFRFDQVQVVNSFDAHRVLHYAESQGRKSEVLARLFRAHFSEGRDISDFHTLSGLSADSGLDSTETINILANGSYTNEVSKDVLEARKLGIRSVPAFYFNRRLVISGAQEVDVFLRALHQAWDEQPRNDVIEPLDGSVCAPEGECDE
jgi:predicted DsbA family dithiol-disulfide isomerase